MLASPSKCHLWHLSIGASNQIFFLLVLNAGNLLIKTLPEVYFLHHCVQMRLICFGFESVSDISVCAQDVVLALIPQRFFLASHELFLFGFVWEFYECHSVGDLPERSHKETCRRWEAGDDSSCLKILSWSFEVDRCLEEPCESTYLAECKDQRKWQSGLQSFRVSLHSWEFAASLCSLGSLTI